MLCPRGIYYVLLFISFLTIFQLLTPVFIKKIKPPGLSKPASARKVSASGPILSAGTATGDPNLEKTSQNLTFWPKVGLRLRLELDFFGYFGSLIENFGQFDNP